LFENEPVLSQRALEIGDLEGSSARETALSHPLRDFSNRRFSPILADFMKKDPQTETVLDAALELHRESGCRLVGIQAPRFEPEENLRKSC